MNRDFLLLPLYKIMIMTVFEGVILISIDFLRFISQFFLLVLIENLYQTLKAVFDYIVKALEVRQIGTLLYFHFLSWYLKMWLNAVFYV